MFKLMSNIYCKNDCKWISEIEESVFPFVLNRFLLMNDKISKHVKFLNRYTYYLEVKHWLALAWSILPKYNEPPFFNYLKKENNEDEYKEVFDKIRKYLDLSDNDFNSCEMLLRRIIDNDKVYWFKKLGLPKEMWYKHGVDYEQIKFSDVKKGKSGLELFGL